MTSSTRWSASIWRVRDDRYSEERSEATAELPRAEMYALGGRPGESSPPFGASASTGASTPRPQPGKTGGQARRRRPERFVDNPVDPLCEAAVPSVLPEGADRGRSHRDHLNEAPPGRTAITSRSPRRTRRRSHQRPPALRSLRALRFPRPRKRRRGRPAGRDRHPGVDTPPAAEARGPRAVTPWTRIRGPHAFRSRRLQPPRRSRGVGVRLTPRRSARRSTAHGRSRRPRSRPASRRSRRRSANRRRSRHGSASSWARGWAAWRTTSTIRSRSRSSDLPGWPVATAPGHVGRLLLGTLAGVPVVDAPGPVPPLRGQRPGARRPARAAVQGAWARRSWSSPMRRAASNPAYGPGTLMVISRPPEPHRPDAAAGPERRRVRAALRRPHRGLGAALRSALRAAGPAEGVELEPRASMPA